MQPDFYNGLFWGAVISAVLWFIIAAVIWLAL